MIEVRNVTKSFDGFKALDDLSINVPTGAIYGLVVPNGAGKSTIIRHITGIYRQDEGEVLEGIRSRWVDVQIEHGIPGLALRYDIILREGCPETRRIVSSTNGVNILLTFWQCIIIALSSIDGVNLL